MVNRGDAALTTWCRLETAAERIGTSAHRVRIWVRYGLVSPARVHGREMFFGDAELARLRRIRRLSDDLGLNLAGLEVTLRLIDEVERLRAELERLKRER